jgi:hypothetical protein
LEIIVETFLPHGEPSRSDVRVRPVAGQGFDPGMRVECSKSMRSSFPVGQLFRLRVILKSKAGGPSFLYSNHRDPWSPVSPQEATKFIKKMFGTSGSSEAPVSTTTSNSKEPASVLSIKKKANAYPVIAAAIRALGSDGAWVRRSDLIQFLRKASPKSIADPELAGNMIDWFSAHWTQCLPHMTQYQAEFRRTRLADPKEEHYAYAMQQPEAYELANVPADFPEGGRRTIVINAYERNWEARQVCISHYGATCFICGFDFALRYGKLGKGYIHVHHRKPLAEIGTTYSVDPIRDLIPVCPNCHSMLHAQPGEVMDVEALRQHIRAAESQKASQVDPS